MAPTPTKSGKQERRAANASPYARPAPGTSRSAAPAPSTPSGLRGFFRKLWGHNKTPAAADNVDHEAPVDETAAESDESDVVLVNKSELMEQQQASSSSQQLPPRLSNAQGWNDPPSFVNFASNSFETSTPVKGMTKSASLFDLGRSQQPHPPQSPVADLESFFRLKRERNEPVTAEEAANVVKLVSDAQQRPPQSDFTFSMPPPQSMNSPKLTSSHSLPSLSSMLKSPASRTNPRNKLTYFGPGQSSASALRRGKSVMPLPSASRPISSSSNPEDDEVATKKRKVEQTDANRLPFAQPSYIATPERKASISKDPLLSASRLPSLNKPAFADPPKPSPLKAALSAKQQQSASTPQKEAPKAATPKTTRAADLMQNIIKEEQASQPKMEINDIVNPYAKKDAPLARLPRPRARDKTPLQNKTSKGKLVDPADASVPQVPDMRTQLEMSMPVEYRQALALAQKEAALKKEVDKEPAQVDQTSSITDPSILPPVPSQTKLPFPKVAEPKAAAPQSKPESSFVFNSPDPTAVTKPESPATPAFSFTTTPATSEAQSTGAGKPSVLPAENKPVASSSKASPAIFSFQPSTPKPQQQKEQAPAQTPQPVTFVSSASQQSKSGSGEKEEEEEKDEAAIRASVLAMAKSQLPSQWGFDGLLSGISGGDAHGDSAEVKALKDEVLAQPKDRLPKFGFVLA